MASKGGYCLFVMADQSGMKYKLAYFIDTIGNEAAYFTVQNPSNSIGQHRFLSFLSLKIYKF